MINVLSIINGIRNSFVYIIGGATLFVLLLAVVVLVKNILNRQRSSFIVMPDLYPEEDRRESISFSADDIEEIDGEIPVELKEISSKQDWGFFDDFIALDGTSPELEDLIHADVDSDKGFYTGAQEAIADVNVSDYQNDLYFNYNNTGYSENFNMLNNHSDNYLNDYSDDYSNDYSEPYKLEHMIENVSNDPWEESEYDSDYNNYIEPLKNEAQDDTWSNMFYGTTVEEDEQVKKLDEFSLDNTKASIEDSNSSLLPALDLAEKEHSSSNNELYENFGFDVQTEENDNG